MEQNPTEESSIAAGLSEEAARIGTKLQKGFKESPQGLAKTLLNFGVVMSAFDELLQRINFYADDGSVLEFVQEMIEDESGLHSTSGKSHRQLFESLIEALHDQQVPYVTPAALLKRNTELSTLTSDDPRTCLFAAALLLKLHHDFMRGILGACAATVSMTLVSHPYFDAHACGDKEAQRMVEAYESECATRRSSLDDNEIANVIAAVEALLLCSFGIELTATATA